MDLKKNSSKASEKASRQSKKARFADTPGEVDLNEDEPMADQGDSEGDSEDSGESSEGEEEEEEEEGVSLSAMLDGSASGNDDAESASGSESDEENEDANDEDDALLPSDDESAPQDSDALDKLDRFIDELNPVHKRKASELGTDTEATRKRKRRALVERNEAGVESEFATRGGPEGQYRRVRGLAMLLMYNGAVSQGSSVSMIY